MQNVTPVLHIDVDVFFCQACSLSFTWCKSELQDHLLGLHEQFGLKCGAQVEQNLHPSLKGRAFAIQQHQDIIAVSIVSVFK